MTFAPAEWLTFHPLHVSYNTDTLLHMGGQGMPKTKSLSDWVFDTPRAHCLRAQNLDQLLLSASAWSPDKIFFAFLSLLSLIISSLAYKDQTLGCPNVHKYQPFRLANLICVPNTTARTANMRGFEAFLSLF